MRIVVIGGGITGRLVGLRSPSVPTILDWSAPPRADRLTRNFGTNYLWEPLDGIPCRAFSVVTCVDGQVPHEASIRQYKQKVDKELDGGDWFRQFQHRMDGYDIVHLPEVPITYNTRIQSIDLVRRVVFTETGGYAYDHLVTTIPMFAFLKLVVWGAVQPSVDPAWLNGFHYSPIYVKVGPRPPDAPYPEDVMYVNYISDPDIPVYRVCDRGGERHWEGLTNMGLTPTKKLVPGKIHLHPRARFWKDFLRTFNVACFGRYASWNADELVHETDQEIKQWAASL